ncbi:MAG: GNAT family N-acetyltransferase [Brevundimonas sp.]
MHPATPETRLDSQARIVAADFADDQVRELLALHFAQMRGQSPADACHVLDIASLKSPDISLFALWRHETLLGVGALKALHDGTGEIKSMRTRPDAVGRGVGGRILEHIIEEAVRRGYRRLSLETGSGPAFEAALKLYRRRGFAEGEPFGGYPPTDFTVFLHLDLPAPERGP